MSAPPTQDHPFRGGYRIYRILPAGDTPAQSLTVESWGSNLHELLARSAEGACAVLGEPQAEVGAPPFTLRVEALDASALIGTVVGTLLARARRDARSVSNVRCIELQEIPGETGEPPGFAAVLHVEAGVFDAAEEPELRLSLRLSDEGVEVWTERSLRRARFSLVWEDRS